MQWLHRFTTHKIPLKSPGEAHGDILRTDTRVQVISNARRQPPRAIYIMRYSSSSRKRLQYVHICLLVSISRFYGTWNSIKPPIAIGTHRISWGRVAAVSGRCTCTLLHLEGAIRWPGTEEREYCASLKEADLTATMYPREGMNISRHRDRRDRCGSRPFRVIGFDETGGGDRRRLNSHC